MGVMDKNPRRFVLTVTEVDANLLPASTTDLVDIQFAGKMYPSSLDRLGIAIKEGNWTISEKRML